MAFAPLLISLVLGKTAIASPIESLADEVVRLTNAERKKAGLLELSNHSLLEAMAERMVTDLSILGVMRHEDRKGRDLFTRADLAGYPWVAIGENVAQGQRTPKQVVAAWMKSPSHRATLLSTDYREIGVAYVSSRKGRYWVQIFGSR